MGVTGALISFEGEILRAINPGVVTVTPARTPPLPAPVLIERITAQVPNIRIVRLIVDSDPHHAATVTYTVDTGEKGKKKEKERGRQRRFVDPANGRMLEEARGEGFFETVENLHRWLALPGRGNGIGRQLTGFAALSLIFFALSGLYLRWPRRPLDWRNWLVLDLRKTGRNLYRALHAVIGGWVLIFYLISASTGLWWSYGWYRDGVQYLLGAERAAAHGPKSKDSGPANLPLARASFTKATAGKSYEQVTASVRDGAVQFRAKLPGGRHDRVSDEMTIDGTTGRVITEQRYDARQLNEDILTSVYEIHRGAYFGIAGRVLMALASLTMPLFTITGFLLYFARRRRKAALGQVLAEVPPAPVAGATTLVAYASQTGTAERIARLTAQVLPDAAAVPITDLDHERLAQARRLFVVASTYGEGEPPDSARGFARVMASEPSPCPVCAMPCWRWATENMTISVPSAIRSIAGCMRAAPSGCSTRSRLMATMPMPSGCGSSNWPAGRAHRSARLGAGADARLAAGRAAAPQSRQQRRADLACRAGTGRCRCRLGGGRYPRDIAAAGRTARHRLPARDGLADTAALRERLRTSILPSDAGPGFDPDTPRPLAHREYSIASLGVTGRAALIVRLCEAPDGLPGLGSGWLCEGAPLGSVIGGRVHANPAFHSPDDASTPIVLIGNGTGLAGLLGHLRQRAATGGGAAGSIGASDTRIMTIITRPNALPMRSHGCWRAARPPGPA